MGKCGSITWTWVRERTARAGTSSALDETWGACSFSCPSLCSQRKRQRCDRASKSPGEGGRPRARDLSPPPGRVRLQSYPSEEELANRSYPRTNLGGSPGRWSPSELHNQGGAPRPKSYPHRVVPSQLPQTCPENLSRTPPGSGPPGSEGTNSR